MPSPQKILSLLLLLFAAIALATPKNKRPKYGWPTVNYQVTSGDPRDTYAIRGNNWNVTEAQLKAGINTPGTVLTGWELKSAINVDDIHTFKAKVCGGGCWLWGFALSKFPWWIKNCLSMSSGRILLTVWFLFFLLRSSGCRSTRKRRLRRN